MTAESIADIAEQISAMPLPRLLTFDCDGVLAPLVDHADDSVRLDGVGALLTSIATLPDTTVAVLSGRSLDGLAQFEFADEILVAGSYGSEQRGVGEVPLTQLERDRLARLDAITEQAAAAGGEGAWVERKPASVVVHVRAAAPERRAAALHLARTLSADLEGHELHDGDNVVELMARPTDKAVGLQRLRIDAGAASVFYAGDDHPDEVAFAVADIALKIGPGQTVAANRLGDPEAVRSLLEAILDAHL